MYLTEKRIALEVQTQLNSISASLYALEDIATKVVFYVTPDVQEYERMREMEYEVGDDILYTPILLRRVTSTMTDDFVQGTYTEGFMCDVFAYEKDKDSIELIFNQYVYTESQNDSKHIEEWTVIKANTGKLKYVQNYPATDGTDEPRLYYTLDFTWQYVLGGIMDEDATITINGSAIDVIGLAFTSDKISIANIPYGTNTLPNGATGFTLALTIPAQNVQANKDLFDDLASKRYNKSYTIGWTIANFSTKTFAMTMKSGTCNYVRDQLISYTVVFEEALPRTGITVDTITLPVLDFMMHRIPKIQSNADGIEQKHTPQETNYQMTIKFGYNSSQAKSRELLQAILNKNYMTNTYVIALTIAGGITASYTCYLADGVYAFQQTGELMYECTFVEAHPNGI